MGLGVGFSRKSQDAAIEAMKVSQIAAMEYMNMTNYIGEPEDQGDDDWGDFNDEVIEEFTASVVKQGDNITAMANAVTTLDCRLDSKMDASILNNLSRKVSDGPYPVDHSRRYKAMDAFTPYTIVMSDIVQSVNQKYVHVERVDEGNVMDVLRVYDEYTSISLNNFGSRVPNFYYYLGKMFLVWDEGRESILSIFRNLYNLRNVEDFKNYCKLKGYTVVHDSFGEIVGVALHDNTRKTGRIIHPERVRGDTVVGVNRSEGRRDRVSNHIVDTSRPFFDSDLTKGKVFEFDDVKPLPARVDDLEYSYAEAMKAKRDGKTWDVRTLGDGSSIRISPTPKLTMAEEIEQRLIDKYLT